MGKTAIGRSMACAAVLGGLLLLVAPAPRAALTATQEICCVLKPGISIDEINQRWGTYILSADIESRMYRLGISTTTAVEDLARAMEIDTDVEVAEPNRVLQTPEALRQMVLAAVGGTFDDYVDQSFTMRIDLDQAHEISRGEGITVAVLDTGIDRTHAALEGHLTTFGYDAVDDDQDPGETANGLDDDGDGEIDEGYGHGTMVAGLVALVAPDARIMPIRVLDDEGRGTVFTVTRGMMKAISHGAQVINMSFGAPYVMRTISDKLHVGNVQSVITYAGAGNRDLEEPAYHPASDRLARMVVALDSLDIKADFSDYNPAAFIAAPGAGLFSTYPGSTWAVGSGCSFATPIVSGAAALVLSLHPDYPAAQVNASLAGGVADIYGLSGNLPYAGKLGAGRVDLLGALRDPAAAGEDGPVAEWTLTVWPNPAGGRVNFRLPETVGRAPLRLSILDASGRVVLRREAAGIDGLAWDGCDPAGRPQAAGIYWARIECGRFIRTAPITLLR